MAADALSPEPVPTWSPRAPACTAFENFVAGGLAPFEALLTATAWAAETLGAGDDLDTIAPGRLADLLIIDGDPPADIRATRNLRTVVKNGEL